MKRNNEQLIEEANKILTYIGKKNLEEGDVIRPADIGMAPKKFFPTAREMPCLGGQDGTVIISHTARQPGGVEECLTSGCGLIYQCNAFVNAGGDPADAKDFDF